MGKDLVVPSDEEEWEDWVERRAREKREMAAKSSGRIAGDMAAAEQGPLGPFTTTDNGPVMVGEPAIPSTVGVGSGADEEWPAESSRMAQMRLSRSNPAEPGRRAASNNAGEKVRPPKI
jgi:hypothetical protein